MTNPDIPTCWCCGHQLDRIDHAAVEHLILDGDVFRMVNVNDPLPGQAFGLGGEVQLRCGHCGAAVPVQYRKFFYQRWDSVLAVVAAPVRRDDGGCPCGYRPGSRPTQIGCGNTRCPFRVE